jgi:hypothetical protein
LGWDALIRQELVVSMVYVANQDYAFVTYSTAVIYAQKVYKIYQSFFRGLNYYFGVGLNRTMDDCINSTCFYCPALL